MCVFFIAFLFAAAHEPNIITSSSGSMNIQLCKNNPSVVICALIFITFVIFISCSIYPMFVHLSIPTFS